MDQTKRCSVNKGCGQTKSIKDFTIVKIDTENKVAKIRYICKECQRKYTLNRMYNNPELELIKESKRRAKKKNIEHSITVEDIKIPDKCPILGIKLEKNKGGKSASSNSPSLDRIDPNGGYTKDNVNVISHRANTLKNNATLEELKMIIDALEKMNGKKTADSR